MTAVLVAPGTSSSGVSNRPAIGGTPSICSIPPVTLVAVTRIGSDVPPPDRFAPPTVQVLSASQVLSPLFRSSYSGGEVQNRLRPPFGNVGNSVYRRTSSSGFRYGSGLRRTALTTLKIAVVAPIPSVIQMMAATVKPGFERNMRKP